MTVLDLGIGGTTRLSKFGMEVCKSELARSDETISQWIGYLEVRVLLEGAAIS